MVDSREQKGAPRVVISLGASNAVRVTPAGESETQESSSAPVMAVRQRNGIPDARTLDGRSEELLIVLRGLTDSILRLTERINTLEEGIMERFDRQNNDNSMERGKAKRHKVDTDECRAESQSKYEYKQLLDFESCQHNNSEIPPQPDPAEISLDDYISMRRKVPKRIDSLPLFLDPPESQIPDS
jgi:hypothetical protein